ncbi:(2,3-dihydroxybenzoyl)adenylate synthase [[Clostridium] polysaccharolyticum]|uniref:Yersiniabactin salicyl-AMP ligase n=1 Tax=[Clostridium] polysaccharolyticum TaxID=29364 RepID=A0A1I0ED72_9FIRM|nr:AMP-binding protein [[Clostridium] polysaccharolyticum]SET42727.1 yersiniabactin salicyl-AMP ligase [[Clostridium] polysaccharolyticum]
MKQYQKDYSTYEALEGWEKASIGQQLRNWAKRYQDQVAVADEKEKITYRELNEKADSMAFGFLEMGIQPGDKVVVQLPNRISFVKTLFALIRAGAVPILALPAHREAELEGIIKLAKPAAYIVAEKYLGYDYLPMARKLKKNFDCLKAVIVDGEQKVDFLLDHVMGESRQLPEVDPYEPAVFLLSGGTTGIPKLIPRTHADYMYNARMSAKRCQLKEESVYLASLPVAHNFPLCCPGLLGTLDAGGKVILSATTSPDDILSLISEEKVTITALVPAMVTVCMELLQWDEDYDISSLKILQVGGAVLEDSLADKINEEWPDRLMQVFGTAEGLLCFTSMEDEKEVVARCQGKPISPADEVKIVDEYGFEVAVGEYGELLSRGPYTIDGYYMADEANQNSFTEDGFYKTGDRATWTKEGNIRMGGRLKEQINRAGEKIMPAEVEAFLCKHEHIKEAAVVGVPDKELGNRICAFLMTEEDAELSLSEVHRYLKREGIATYKMPDQVEQVEVWPLTSVGKIDKKVLVQMAQGKKDERENAQ